MFRVSVSLVYIGSQHFEYLLLLCHQELVLTRLTPVGLRRQLTVAERQAAFLATT